jgi:hypothetical protein
MTDVLAVDTGNMDPTTAEMFLRLTCYLRAMEGALVQAGIVGLGDVEKRALREVSLKKLDSLQAFVKQTEDAINQIPNPQIRADEQMKWELSPHKEAVTNAIATTQRQLAETMED